MGAIWKVAVVVFVCDVAFTVVTITVFKTSGIQPPADGAIDTSAVLGWLGAAAAVFCFGCYGILIKSSTVQEVNTDCVVFQCYYSFAVSLISFFIWICAASSALCISSPSFGYGLLFGILWNVSQVFAYKAIQILGYAIGPALWIGATICVSFVWGVVAFNNSVVSWPGAVCAIVGLLIGVGLAALSNCISDAEARSVPENAKCVLTESDTVRSNGFLGYFCAIAVGLTNGSLMVPMSCYQQGCFGTSKFDPAQFDGDVAALAFLPSLSLGVLAALPILFFLYWGPSMVRGTMPKFHLNTIALPALTTGLYWGMGNFNAMMATLYLGQTVGYPLTQCCLILNGVWGILYYKEIQGGRAISIFVLASLVILMGASFDGMWG